MQVNCPSCGEKVTADYINIQKMTAVCAACDTVFPFDLPEAKAKRRKIKQPARLTLRDAEELLHLEFGMNFRSDRSEALFTGAFGGVMLFIAFLLITKAGVPLILPLFFLLIAAALFYWLAQIVVNRTHIEMDEDTIKVTRKPIPNLLNQGHEVSLAGVAAIKYEETAISKKEGYEVQRYRVWAETADGSRRTIVNDVIEDYAAFIVQRLDERLHMDADLDVSRLEDGEHHLDDEADRVEVGRTSQNHRRS